jgi:D-inositol-3-phosphate glycosyltransferase
VNIVIVGTAYPLRGGIAHYNALLARALSARHEVHTITFKRQYPSFLFPGKTQEEQGGAHDVPPAPQLVDSVNPFNWVGVGRMIRRLKPDLLLFKYWLPFFGPCFGTIARMVKRNAYTRTVVICDNVIPHERRPFDRAFTRYLFRVADGFIVQSHAVEEELGRFWPSARYRYVPHPVYDLFGTSVPKDEARALLGLPAGRLLLFFGYVRRYKGLQVLLEAMARLDRALGVRLLVVGEFYDGEQEYRDQIRSSGLDNVVTVRSEYVANAEVGTYFSAADAVVLPYTSATQSGIAQIAYNFDRPVLVSNVGGLAEIVVEGESGYIVPSNDPEALAAAITRLYTEGTLDVLTRGAAVEKKKYTWENLVRGIEDLAAEADQLNAKDPGNRVR